MIFFLFLLFAAFAAFVTAAATAAVAPVAATPVVAADASAVNTASSILEHIIETENIEDIVDYDDVVAPSVRTRKDEYGYDIAAPSSMGRTMYSRNKSRRARIYKKGKVRRIKAPHKSW